MIFSQCFIAGVMYGPCAAPLENIAVYEGNLSVLIYFPASPNGVRWSTLATTDELTKVDIVNYNDQVDPTYAADYVFDPQSGLTIINATTTADYNVHQLSTSGLYTVECGGNDYSVKVLIVRKLTRLHAAYRYRGL